MIEYDAGHEAVARQFADQGIPTDMPGFYDHPNFLKVEQRVPTYLNNYARLVATRAYSEEYLASARREIPLIAASFHRELAAEGRLGACVDGSSFLSRILEREGYWNHVVKGSLTITFPSASKIRKRFFWTFDEGNFVAGHAWLYAPPFAVLDVTVRLQPYKGKEGDYLPDMVLAENPERAEGTPEDIMSPERREYLTRRGVRQAQQVSAARATLPTFMRTFPASAVRERYTRLKYIPTAVGAPAEPLEEMTAMTFSGRTGAQLYAETIRTMLAEARDQ